MFVFFKQCRFLFLLLFKSFDICYFKSTRKVLIFSLLSLFMFFFTLKRVIKKKIKNTINIFTFLCSEKLMR